MVYLRDLPRDQILQCIYMLLLQDLPNFATSTCSADIPHVSSGMEFARHGTQRVNNYNTDVH